MKSGNIVVLTISISISISIFVAIKYQNYHEAQSWQIDIKQRAAVYETDSYPYATMSPKNKIVRYLEVGENPEVVGIWYGKDFPYWKVKLTSNQSGYIFAPDVEFSHKW